MNIDVNTKKMAVIGDPIEHSLSPLMHNSIIQANGFNAVYFPFHVKPSELRRYAESLRNLEFSGFNATMTHKQALLSIVDEIDGEAARYQSVNTVIITDGKLIGYYDAQQNACSGGKSMRGSGICVCRGSDPRKYERRGEGCGRHHKLHFSGNVRYRCGFYRFIVFRRYGGAALRSDL